MQRKRKSSGFTLVEIMIVLAILVLLLSMVGPRLLKTQEKADQKITVTQIKSLQQALDMYKVSNRFYPSTEEGLQALLERPADEARSANWDGPYLSEQALPVDPWGKPYHYEFPPTHGKSLDVPDIWSSGPDGQENTPDDIVNWTREEGETGDAAQPGDELAGNP